MKIASDLTELVGHTPLLRLRRFAALRGAGAHLFAKLEYLNPAGSAKDRVALSLIEDAERQGVLQPGATIIEPTSGNTGIGLAAIGAARGYHVVLTMPDSMSRERRNLLSAYGASVVLTPAEFGMMGAIRKATELSKETPNSFIPSQFENAANPDAHYRTTGPEIYEALDGKVDVFVAGIGTGGTISGVGKYLKEKNPNIQIIGLEPAEAPFLTQGKGGAHPLQGIGAGFVPSILNSDVIDDILCVSGEFAYRSARQIVRTEGLLIGTTSGAAAHIGAFLSKQPRFRDKNIVMLFPDSGERYMSTPLFRESEVH